MRVTLARDNPSIARGAYGGMTAELNDRNNHLAFAGGFRKLEGDCHVNSVTKNASAGERGGYISRARDSLFLGNVVLAPHAGAWGAIKGPRFL